jgi:protein-tyrosine-phosphatase
MVKESEILTKIVDDVRSAAVFNRSAELHSKARVSLLAQGFSENEVDAHKPAFKFGDAKLFESADVIIGMTKFHKWLTPRKYRSKFTTLSQIATNKYTPIEDPFLKKSQEGYNSIMEQLYMYLKAYATKLEVEYNKRVVL